MKSQSPVLGLEATKATSTVTLHDFISQISMSLAPAAMDNKSFIVNDIPYNIASTADQDLLATVFSSLMNVIIMNTQNSCIRITAKTYGNVVLVHVTDDGCMNYMSMSQNLTRVQPLAVKMGGYVGITSYRNKLTTIAFSFMNERMAA